MLLLGCLLFPTCIADAGKSAKSMARGRQGLPREMGGDPLDLLDAGTSRKMVKHAAAARGAAAAGPAREEEDEFEHADDGKMIIRVCWLPCGKTLYRPQIAMSVKDPAQLGNALGTGEIPWELRSRNAALVLSFQQL